MLSLELFTKTNQATLCKFSVVYKLIVTPLTLRASLLAQ